MNGSKRALRASEVALRILRLEAGVPKTTREAVASRGWPVGESDGGFGRYKCVKLMQSGFGGHTDRG